MGQAILNMSLNIPSRKRSLSDTEPGLNEANFFDGSATVAPVIPTLAPPMEAPQEEIETVKNESGSNNKRKARSNDDAEEAGLNEKGDQLCSQPNCTNKARTGRGGLCKKHGGRARCKFVDNDGVECNKFAQSGGFCIKHGGGKKCSVEDCDKKAQAGGKCCTHGGGKYCSFEGCGKRAQSGGCCISHGGGKVCPFEGCGKKAQKGGYCKGHTGGVERHPDVEDLAADGTSVGGGSRLVHSGEEEGDVLHDRPLVVDDEKAEEN